MRSFVLSLLTLLANCRAFAPLTKWQRTSFLETKEVSRASTTTAGAAVVTLNNSKRVVGVTPLYAKLWERLQIEEDEEPMWYLINCVAGLEMDLLRQCREACRDMPDAVKFVVPTEKKTRSHGAKKMVTETKVKYQGYVFAKLRLCPEVYEAIQSLDLCRSWMGTVNHKGHRKLPPAPIALNELEVENFGLEKCEAEEKEDEAGASDIIVDVADEAAESKIDKEAIKVYLGLKVEDMVKVTAKGKFFNEDGIIRRLKDGKLLVRFYTYGTMFEEWLDPGDLRKLSNIEILKGLSGPTRPVTQRDFDGPSSGYDESRPRDMRRNLVSEVRGSGPRSRRQDRNERRFRSDGFRNDDERGRNDRNWNWYQDQQQDSRRRNDFGDRSYGYQAGSNNQRRDRGGDWAIGNVDSQWGRNPSQNKRQPRQDTRRQNQQADAAIRGDDDWSAFVTPAGGASGNSDDDDFFASLMNDLSSDLRKNEASAPKSSTSSGKSSFTNDDDDFFSSLLSEISDDDSPKQNQSKPRPKQQTRSSSGDDEDFFAALEAELGSAVSEGDGSLSKLDDSDDLFAKLEAELSPQSETLPGKPKPKPLGSEQPTKNDTDDFFASLEAEQSSPGQGNAADSTEDFFAALEADLAQLSDSTEQSATLDDLFGDTQDAEVKEKRPKMTKKGSSEKSSASTATSINPGDLQKQTVPALKDMLRERGLKVSGKKSELIERLLQES